MTKTAKFWDNIADGYAKSKIQDERAFEKKLQITRDLFPPEAEVFEIACGTGTTALHQYYFRTAGYNRRHSASGPI